MNARNYTDELSLLDKIEVSNAMFAVGKDCNAEPFIFCMRCRKRSYNDMDIEKRYCGRCHRFHEDPEFVS